MSVVVGGIPDQGYYIKGKYDATVNSKKICLKKRKGFNMKCVSLEQVSHLLHICFLGSDGIAIKCLQLIFHFQEVQRKDPILNSIP